MQITVLSGGVGGARFVRGLLAALGQGGAVEPADGPAGAAGGTAATTGGPSAGTSAAASAGTTVTVVGNTGDDITLFGLRVCPDLDTLLYTLGGEVDEEQGWGRRGDSRRVMEELAALDVTPQWFGLGDLDIGTHLARSRWLGQGRTLSEVTARLAQRWGLPAQGVRLLPATDQPIETHVVVDGDEGPDGPEQAMHFQEWWVRHRAALPARRFTVAGLAQASPAPGVLEAIREADVVLLPPSNPVVSIGIILGVPGVRDALRGTRAPVVGVSPLIGGRPVRGHADACLAPLGVQVSAAGVAGLYADFLTGWLVDDADAPTGVPSPYPRGVTVRSTDILMRDPEGAARIAGAALAMADELR